VLVALTARTKFIYGKRVRFIIDNLGTSTAVMRNGSKVTSLQNIFLQIMKFCLRYKVVFWVRWRRR
jgi:hypothetical protein